MDAPDLKMKRVVDAAAVLNLNGHQGRPVVVVGKDGGIGVRYKSEKMILRSSVDERSAASGFGRESRPSGCDWRRHG